MRRETRFVMSHKPYAVDLSSLREHHGFFYVDAVWFRRRPRGRNSDMITVACIGNLHDVQDPAPKTALELVERYTDGRRGGHCEGRWDGSGYWGIEQCRDAHAAPFVKQLGTAWAGGTLVSGRSIVGWGDRKGSNPLYWDVDLRVREMPHSVGAVA